MEHHNLDRKLVESGVEQLLGATLVQFCSIPAILEGDRRETP